MTINTDKRGRDLGKSPARSSFPALSTPTRLSRWPKAQTPPALLGTNRGLFSSLEVAHIRADMKLPPQGTPSSDFAAPRRLSNTAGNVLTQWTARPCASTSQLNDGVWCAHGYLPLSFGGIAARHRCVDESTQSKMGHITLCGPRILQII